MALASANDASVAMAEKLSGSEAKFVVQMNAKAKAIGMKDSRFKNVSGMPASGHYSSAYDVGRLSLPGRIIQMHWILKLLILLVGALFYARHRIKKTGGIGGR